MLKTKKKTEIYNRGSCRKRRSSGNATLVRRNVIN